MRIASLLSCLILSAAVAGPVFAADGAQKSPAKQGDACRTDIQKYCGAVEKGGGRIKQCIDKNRASFSEACQKQMAEHKARTEKKVEACRADAEKLCKDIQPGGGRLHRCLKENEASLSAACRDSLPKPGDRPKSGKSKSG
jgi:hypothetical protein